MKKVFTVLLVVMISLLASCQATPEKQAVIQKDQAQMIEKAKASDTAKAASKTLRERVGAPATLKDTLTQDNMTIDVDASVDVPDSSGINIIKVKEGGFSQAQVTSLWKELVGNTPMFQTSKEMTKSEIQSAIVFAKGKIGSAKNEDDKEYYQKQIDYFNGIYSSAPEEHKRTPVNGELQDLFITAYGSSDRIPYKGINAASEDGTVIFNIHNSFENSNGSTAQAAFEFHKYLDNKQQEGEPKIDTTEADPESKITPENAKELKLSPYDAKTKAESFLSAAKIPFVVKSAFIKKPAGKSSYYSFSCVREIGNIPCAQILGETYQKDEQSGYTQSWEYEDLFINVDDNGVTGVTWEYPIETEVDVVNNSTIKSFSDIRSIFNKMMFVTYGYQAKDTKGLTCDVTDIKLEMIRINEQNAQKSGLLVPVWDFYGVRTVQNENWTSNKTSKIILMSINAIDGSIIDTSKGY